MVAISSNTFELSRRNSSCRFQSASKRRPGWLVRRPRKTRWQVLDRCVRSRRVAGQRLECSTAIAAGGAQRILSMLLSWGISDPRPKPRTRPSKKIAQQRSCIHFSWLQREYLRLSWRCWSRREVRGRCRRARSGRPTPIAPGAGMHRVRFPGRKYVCSTADVKRVGAIRVVEDGRRLGSSSIATGD